MKLILLAAYLISFAGFQQDGTSAKRTDKAPAAQQQKSEAQNSDLNATPKQPVHKQKAKDSNVSPSPLNSPAKSETPKK
jgi:hypothetical protein